MLQASQRFNIEAKNLGTTIKCIKTYDSVTFTVDKESKSYPVYIPESHFNTDDNYDYGLFEKLKSMVLKTDLNLEVFLASFNYPGVFVFGDSRSPKTA
jgi:hypothetical protein